AVSVRLPWVCAHRPETSNKKGNTLDIGALLIVQWRSVLGTRLDPAWAVWRLDGVVVAGARRAAAHPLRLRAVRCGAAVMAFRRLAVGAGVDRRIRSRDRESNWPASGRGAAVPRDPEALAGPQHPHLAGY